jgi:hypothetical protein
MIQQPQENIVHLESDENLFNNNEINQTNNNNNNINQFNSKSKSYSHPIACIFHLLFKIAALITYLFGYLLIGSFVTIFIVCIVFLALDFWIVKNITGRLLVGLRWWNEIKEDGTNEWIFESIEDKTIINSKEKFLFWITLLITPIFWILFAIASIIKLNPQWLVIVIVALFLNITNIAGYIKCSKGIQFLFFFLRY